MVSDRLKPSVNMLRDSFGFLVVGNSAGVLGEDAVAGRAMVETGKSRVEMELFNSVGEWVECQFH